MVEDKQKKLLGVNMAAKVWKYKVRAEINGVVVGEGLDNVDEAKENLARQHRVKKEEVKVKEPGDKEWK